MRLSIVSFDLGCGGAERKVALLANSWSAQGHSVSVLTFGSIPNFYRLDPQITHRRLDIASDSGGHLLVGLAANYQRVKVLRTAIRETRADVIISFGIETNIRTILSTIGLRVRTVICETTDPSRHSIPLWWRGLRTLTYPFADVITCLTPNVLRWLRPLTYGKGYVIPNPVVVPADNGAPLPKLPGERRLVTMGRLHPDKAVAILIDTFSRLAAKHAGWDLVIIGEGSLRAQLEMQVAALGMGGRVHLLGEMADPFAILRACDLFALTSRIEGFCFALVEAMACGLPVVSFDCPSGPRYIIRHGVDGLLVPAGDAEALRSVLDHLMSDPAARDRLRARGPEVLQRFSLSRFLATWDDVLSYATGLRGVVRDVGR